MALLLWSGGCDSTLLLHDLLSESPKYVQKPATVRTLAVVHPQVGNGRQNDCQAKSRRAVARALRSRGLRWEHSEVTLRQRGAGAVAIGSTSAQPVLWLAQAVPYLDEGEDLCVGYVRGDDVWHYRAQLVWAFQYLQELRGGMGRLLLPLEWVPKTEVIAELKRRRLYGLTWYCEEPKGPGRRCGECKPCRRHRLAKAEAKL